MGFKALDVEEFLARQASWLRKFLQGGNVLTPAERGEMTKGNWPEIYGDARDQYLELLKRHPNKLREYRKLQKKVALESALWLMPSLKPGAPRLDALALEASELEQSGLTQGDIAVSLNRKYPERQDRKGNKKPFTEESVRKLLKRRRASMPDKT